MKHKKQFWLFLTALFITFCGLFGTQSVQAAYSDSHLRSYTKKTMEKNHLRGSIVIVKNGHRQTVSLGYGYYKRRFKNSSSKLVYPVGSLQKMVTAAMITQLIYKGKLSQNTKISRWYPLLKHSSKITVGQLMTHTSGIAVSGTESSHGIRFSEAGAINWTVARANLSGNTGLNKFNYNNANYVLLAGIIRKVTGKSYATNLKSRIIKPLHLRHTYIYRSIPRSKTDAISYLYRYGKNYRSAVYANANVVSQLPGAGNLFSTAGDYYKIQQGLYNGKILSANQFSYMSHLNSKVNTYSGGFYLKNGGKLKLAYGNFSNTHFINWMQLTKDNKNGIIMFLNQPHGSKNHIKNVGYGILRRIKSGTFIKR